MTNPAADYEVFLQTSAQQGDLQMMALWLARLSKVPYVHPPAVLGRVLKGAIAARKAASVDWLIQHGADIKINDNQALIAAVKIGDAALVRRLLDLGADPCAQKDEPIFWAAFGSPPDKLKALIKSVGVSIDERRLTPKNIENSLKITRMLIDAGADVRADHDRALLWAACKGDSDVVEMLAAHIFRPEAWQGQKSIAVLAVAKDIEDGLRAFFSSGMDIAVVGCGEKAAVEIVTRHAYMIFHKLRREEMELAPLKPAPSKPPRLL